MLEFGDSFFYIDLKALDKAITFTTGKGETSTESEEKTMLDENGKIVSIEKYSKTVPKTKEIDPIKYDLLKMFIEYIIDYDDVSDDTLGSERALSSTPLPFKIAFNTLYNEGIIKEKK